MLTDEIIEVFNYYVRTRKIFSLSLHINEFFYDSYIFDLLVVKYSFEISFKMVFKYLPKKFSIISLNFSHGVQRKLGM